MTYFMEMDCVQISSGRDRDSKVYKQAATFRATRNI